MSEKSVNFLELIKNKQYSKILLIIQNEISEEKRTSGLLNLSGICRMMLSKSDESLKLAINDFRNSYLKETDKTKSIEPFKNLVTASVIYFDNQFIKNEILIGKNFFKEIILIFNENNDLFEQNLGLMRAIFKVFKRTSDAEKIIECIKKIIKLNSDSDVIASYCYFNNYLNDWSQSDHLDNAKTLNDKLTIYSPQKLVSLKKSINKRINLGFISSDIRSKHSVSYFLKSVVSNYNSSKFQIYMYHNHDTEDETTKEFENYFFKSTRVSKLSDQEAINTIRKDEIDILVDLNGFSSKHRLALFKNRLAPIQISWCGYTNTMGIKEMDYLIVDKNLISPNEENLYSEKIIYLPNIWNCHSGYDLERLENEMPSKKNNFITFGSFNNFLKINDTVIEVWASILRKIKNSKLVLKTSNSISLETYKKKFEKYNVADSVNFLNYSKNFNEHLNTYKQIDVALDTFPWNGVTTTFEAIWMNVPVIVMDGFNFNSRCGSSILKNLKLSDLIAKDKQDYIDKAVSLVEDQQKLQYIRTNLFHNALKTPLFDKKKFSDNFFYSLEKIYK